MTNADSAPASLPNRRLVGLIAGLAALVALALPALAGRGGPEPKLPKPAVLTFKLAQVGKPGNPSVAIVPFTSALYPNCAAAPPEPKLGKSNLPDPCQEVGSVPYEYGIGEVEVTVEQYVAFLNTVDPFGRNQMGLYSETESGTAWPRYGQIDYSALARAGKHYTAAAPEWNDKPYGFANFLRSARFDNSVANGKVLSQTESTVGSGNRNTGTSPTRCGSRGGPRPGCTTCTRGPRCGRRNRASSSPARTSGSRPPTTTGPAAAPTPTGGTRPTPAAPSPKPARRAR